MTLILTALAACIATVFCFILPRTRVQRLHLGVLALMYWGASLMWSVDGFFCLAEGEPFIELTDPAVMADDALLGASVVVLGIVAWLIINVIKRRSGAKATVA